MHDETPRAAGTEIEFVKRVGKTIRPPPMDEVVGVAAQFEKEITRHSKDACVYDFGFVVCIHTYCLSQ
jgi:hypothetical protein